ncbi:glucokinase [Porticoccus sp. W117]|uniref:glucokinase n=1 Tax=Porticoccus sp. W117 TaxID=3054777 RepID=UPI002597196C|nr:glucokinase [Porticoccus sp. W117]MDM3870029.1 glucokinase [Porticoccus sp. W117]
MPDNISLVADIGGTNARFAWVEQGQVVLRDIKVYQAIEYPGLMDALQAYLQDFSLTVPQKICFAIAGMVNGDHINLMNNHWSFSKSQLSADLGVEVTVINDFSAQAYSIDCLPSEHIHWLGEPRPAGGEPRTVIGPGTGLGVAIQSADGELIPSEGGHVSFAPHNAHEDDLLRLLRKRLGGRISNERLLSGQGLENLYWANAQLQGKQSTRSAPQVVDGCAQGDSICRQALDDFVMILASVCGDLALLTLSSGGVYLTGGILPRVWQWFDTDAFRTRFADKGRYRAFCETVPVAMIRAEQPGLLGCAAALGGRREDR